MIGLPVMANPRNIPPASKAAIRANPDAQVILPTGARLHYMGLAYRVSSNTSNGSDILPYTKGVKM